MFLIYSFLYGFIMALLLPFEYARRPKEIRAGWLREKFGFSNSLQRSSESKAIWIHAVSMGEVIASVRFIKELKAEYASANIIISTVTDTGRKIARERLSDIAEIVYIPFDLGFILKRFLKNTKPNVFIAVETELWPNIFRTLKQNRIPILIMNGRISEKSFKGYRRIGFFMKHVISCVDIFCMQEPVYAERIKGLGAEDDKVTVTGNFKFDTRPPDKLPEWSALLKGPVIIAGSTHATEEELIIDAYLKLKADFSVLNLIIAPRHPERFGEVEEIVKKKGLACVNRSAIDKSAFNAQTTGFVIVLDVVGELASAYGISDIAIMGGSFIQHGGQNPLEPACWGKPVVCGPHMENFPFIEDFYRKGGALKAEGKGLYEVLKELLSSVEKRKKTGELARALYNEKAGSVNRALKVFRHYYPKNRVT